MDIDEDKIKYIISYHYTCRPYVFKKVGNDGEGNIYIKIPSDEFERYRFPLHIIDETYRIIYEEG